MRTVRIPVRWMCEGLVEVMANSWEEAVEHFNPHDHAVPAEGVFVEGSFELDSFAVEMTREEARSIMEEEMRAEIAADEAREEIGVEVEEPLDVEDQEALDHALDKDD